MAMRWMSLALLASWLGLSSTASAQYLPDGQPSAPLADPVAVPSAPGSSGVSLASDAAVPGPMTGALAPYGPNEDLMLPANHSSAFPTEPRYEPGFCFFHIGTLALKRQRLGNGITAFTDTTNVSRLDTGRDVNRNGFAPLLNLNDLNPPLIWGGTATIGCMMGSYSLELSGFYLPETSETAQVQRQGQLASFFFNSPVGFEGNNNLFRQADIITQTFTSEMAGGELNMRYFSQAYTSMELLCGVRYLDYMERLSINVNDDGLTFRDIRNQPDLRRIATYSSRTRNRIVGPQLGMECQHGICQGIAFGAFAKATAGVNIANADQSLTRGDAVVGFNDTRNSYTFACVFDLGVYFDFYFLERLRLRTGYQALGLTGILEAPDQVNYNLNQVGGTRDVSGSAFFHGATVQLQFLF